MLAEKSAVFGEALNGIGVALKEDCACDPDGSLDDT